jgi:uncharacterized protein involved in type VI secretion and phage assembly
MNGGGPPYLGKFRGVVTNNRDPLQLGRVRARVPDVFGDKESGWALPAAPYAGKGVGFFMIPPVDASVWMEFEHGDPDYPIWTGCFWGSGEVPASPANAEIKMIKTEAATITLNDTAGSNSVLIETTAGMKVEIKGTGIEINNGQGANIKLNGPTVSVNENALAVT